MAEHSKNHPPPITTQVDAPPALAPLMQAFHTEDEETAKVLIREAASVIAPVSCFEKLDPSEENIELITALMRGLKPRDSLETLYAAQIIVSHVLGMRNMASTHKDDQDIGLKMLKFSNEAIKNLSNKQRGGNQTINVNYNYHGQGNANLQTIIKGK